MKKKVYSQLNEQLIEIRHKSGIKAYVIPKAGYAKTYAVFATKYGSIDRCFKTNASSEYMCVPDGIAHFLEHKLFEGKDEGAFDRYAKTGASANAYTSFDKTAYLFSCTDNFLKSLEILLDFVQQPYFTDENVAKEQGIIAQEIRMYEDDPNFRVFFNLLESLYINHGAKVDIAGTVESISKIDKDILYSCYNTFYNLNNMVLCIVGDVNISDILKILDKTIIQSEPIKIDRKAYDEPRHIKNNYIEKKLTVSMPLFYMGFKDNDNKFCGKTGQKNELVTRILLEMIAGESSDVYDELYKEGLINKSFSSEYMLCRDFALSAYGGESRDPEKVRDEILKSIEKIKADFSEEDFKRAKKVVYGRMLRAFNSTDAIANGFISAYFNDFNIFDSIDIFKKITKKDAIKRLDSHFLKEYCALSVINAIK